MMYKALNQSVVSLKISKGGELKIHLRKILNICKFRISKYGSIIHRLKSILAHSLSV